MTRYSPIAAVLALLAVLIPVLVSDGPQAKAQEIVTSNGGRLDVIGPEGQLIGSCPLKHTDLDVQVSGRFARVNLTQTFENPYPNKIEAVYTFPLSHRAAVDRMTMTIGERVIVGEVKERRQARRIYEAAKSAGHTTALLEQERPNIFTQSVANIEPGVSIDIHISYVELLQSKDGVFSFDFPMVVGPRYIPGSPTGSQAGPGGPTGQGFSSDTTRVPDASRITPMPTRPEVRAGHDIGVSVSIDTGGPGILDLKSELHEITTTKTVKRDDGAPHKLSLMLKKEKDIPNRDFVLSWRQTADTIEEAVFTHTGKNGNFITLSLQPPVRVKDADAVARELVFVMDTSGSMSGLPIAKSRDVVSKCLARLRPQDSFNIITFSGNTHILWDKPKPGTPENIAAAQRFVETREGSGGTEMMKAIEAALVQNPGQSANPLKAEELLNLPADGREAYFIYERGDLKHDPLVRERDVPAAEAVKLSAWLGAKKFRCPMLRVGLKGQWVTENTERIFVIHTIDDCTGGDPAPPMRIVCFLTDGYVGNDMEIIAAIQRNAKTTRVFSFGIGNSVNRYLLDSMARAGRGEVEYVLLNSEPDAAVQRFVTRIQTPVLSDVQLAFSEGLEVSDLCGTGIWGAGVSPASNDAAAAPGASPPEQAGKMPASPGTAVVINLPDLFDVKPIILHAKYAKPGRGTLTIRGRTGAGPYERKLDLDLPASQPEHDTIATLWARAKVEQIMNRDLAAAQAGSFPQALHDEIVRLGETFGIMTQFTSFVAVEKQRITIAGQPRLVTVPIEMPQGFSYEGIFGCGALEQLVLHTPVDLQAAAEGEALLQTARGETRGEDRSKRLMEAAVKLQQSGQSNKAVKVLDEALADKPADQKAAFMKQVIQDAEGAAVERELVRGGGRARDERRVVARRDPSAAAPEGLADLDGDGVAETPFYTAMLPSSIEPALNSRGGYEAWGRKVNARYKRSSGVPPTADDDFTTPESLTSNHFLMLNEREVDINGVVDVSDLPKSQAGAPGMLGWYADSYSDYSVDTLDVLQDQQVSRLELEAGVPALGKLSEVKNAYTKPERMTTLFAPAQGQSQIRANTPATRPGDASSQSLGSLIEQERGEMTRTYSINAPVNETAERLDKALLSLTGWDSPYVKAFPSEHKLIISGKPEHFEVVEKLLAQLTATRPAGEEHPATAPSDTQNSLERVSLRLIGWLKALKAAGQLEWARKAMVPQRVAIQIGELLKAGQADDAKALAEALAELDPEYTVGCQMRDALADAKLSPAERDAKVAQLAAEAKRAFDPIIRELKLRDRLDPRLYAFAKLGKAAATRPAGEGVAVVQDRVRATVLAEDTKDTTLAALRKAGLTTEGTTGRLVVGLIAPEKLADLAVLDAVRRIVPTDAP